MKVGLQALAWKGGEDLGRAEMDESVVLPINDDSVSERRCPVPDAGRVPAGGPPAPLSRLAEPDPGQVDRPGGERRGEAGDRRPARRTAPATATSWPGRIRSTRPRCTACSAPGQRGRLHRGGRPPVRPDADGGVLAVRCPGFAAGGGDDGRRGLDLASLGRALPEREDRRAGLRPDLRRAPLRLSRREPRARRPSSTRP